MKKIIMLLVLVGSITPWAHAQFTLDARTRSILDLYYLKKAGASITGSNIVDGSITQAELSSSLMSLISDSSIARARVTRNIVITGAGRPPVNGTYVPLIAPYYRSVDGRYVAYTNVSNTKGTYWMDSLGSLYSEDPYSPSPVNYLYYEINATTNPASWDYIVVNGEPDHPNVPVGYSYSTNSLDEIADAAFTVLRKGTVTGSLIPWKNEVFDLGSSDYRFRDLYLAGSTIHLGGSGAALSVVDDTVVFTTVNGSATNNDQVATLSMITGKVDAVELGTASRSSSNDFASAAQGLLAANALPASATNGAEWGGHSGFLTNGYGGEVRFSSNLLIGSTTPVTDGDRLKIIGADGAEDFCITSNGGVRIYSKDASLLIGTNANDVMAPYALIVKAVSNSYNIGAFISDVDNYSQLNLQNKSSGSNASVDISWTGNNGSEIADYGNIGRNSSGYKSSGFAGLSNELYIYNAGADLILGTTVGRGIKMFAGNILTNNQVPDIGVSNRTTTISSNLVVWGTLTNAGAVGLGSTFLVNGANTFRSTTTNVGAVGLGNTLLVNGAFTGRSTMTNAGNVGLGGTFLVNGANTFRSTTTNVGAVGLGSTLYVAGNTTLIGTTTNAGAVGLGSTLLVNNVLTTRSNIVLNTTTLSSPSNGFITISSAGGNKTNIDSGNISTYLPAVPVYNADGITTKKVGTTISVADWIPKNLVDVYVQMLVHEGAAAHGMLNGPGYLFDDENGIRASACTNYEYMGPGYQNTTVAGGGGGEEVTSAIHLNGPAGAYNHIEFSDALIPDGNESFTYAFYIKPTTYSQGSYPTALDIGGIGENGKYTCIMCLSGHWRISIYGQDTETSVMYTTNWTSIVYTHAGTDTRLYIDGVLAAQLDYTLNITKVGALKLNEGGTPWSAYGRQFYADFSELAVWDRAISESEIATLAGFPKANTNSAPWNSGLVYGWHLDSTSSFTTYGANANNGTLTGAATAGSIPPFSGGEGGDGVTNSMTLVSTNMIVPFIPTASWMSVLVSGIGLTTNDVQGYVSPNDGTTWYQADLRHENSIDLLNTLFQGQAMYTNNTTTSNLIMKVITTSNKVVKILGAFAPSN